MNVVSKVIPVIGFIGDFEGEVGGKSRRKTFHNEGDGSLLFIE